MINLSMARVNEYFSKPPVPGQRAGQSFHDFFELNNLTDPNDKLWADKLYNATSTEAYVMIAAVTGPN